MQETLRAERDLGGGLLAGGVAYRVFLWLVPFGLVVAALFSYWTELDPDGLESAARDFGIGAAAALSATEALQHGTQNATLVLLFGLALLAWFTLGALRALVLAYSLAWQLEPTRIRRPFRAIVFFNGLFLVGFFSSVALAWLHEQVGATAILSTAAYIVLAFAIVLLAMWHLPHRASRPRELAPGALLVAVGSELVHVAVVLYLAPRLGRAEETYGALGAAATMLIWLYVLSRLFTGAAFFNATLQARRRQETEAGPGTAAST